MKTFAKLFSGISLAFVLGAAVWMGLHTADAQTGGGFPSRPNFQAVTVSGTQGTAISASANVAGTQQMNLVNTSTLDGQTARYVVQAGTENLQMGICNQNQVGLCKLVGGPSAPSGFLETFAAVPLCFGTGNTMGMCIDGSQLVTFSANATPAGTLTLSSGCSTTPNVSYTANIIGKLVAIELQTVTCTASGSPVQLTIGALPAALRPLQNQIGPVLAQNAGATVVGVYQINGSTGNITIQITSGAIMTGQVGIGGTLFASPQPITYVLN